MNKILATISSFKFWLSIRKFEKICTKVESDSIIIPDKIVESFSHWKKLQYLDSSQTSKVLTYSIECYLLKYNQIISRLDSYQFFDNFLTYYEYYSQVRKKVKYLNPNISQRIRFVRSIIEEGGRLNLKTSKQQKWNFGLIKDLYESYRNISVISNMLSVNSILNIQSAQITSEKSKAVLIDSSIHSINLRIAQNFINQYSRERYLQEDYLKTFFELLSKFGLKEEEFHEKLSNIFLQSIPDGKLTKEKFEELLKHEGSIFFHLIDGLTLDSEQIISLRERIRKPLKTARHLMYPFPIWTVDQKKYVIVDKGAFIDGFQYLLGDLLCHGYDKTPVQWKNIFSKTDIHSLGQGNNFENKVESILSTKGIPYVKELKIKYNETYFEPDFTFYIKEQNLIIIAECKNLMKRNDPNSWLNDYWRFTKSNNDKPSFNKKMDDICNVVNNDKQQITKAFKTKCNIHIENFQTNCLFITNSPTLYMFASEYLIVTWKMFSDMIENKNFTGTMIFSCDNLLITQNIRFFRPEHFPSQMLFNSLG